MTSLNDRQKSHHNSNFFSKIYRNALTKIREKMTITVVVEGCLVEMENNVNSTEIYVNKNETFVCLVLVFVFLCFSYFLGTQKGYKMCLFFVFSCFKSRQK